MPRRLFKEINDPSPTSSPEKVAAQIDRAAVTRASSISGGLVVGASIGGTAGTLIAGPIGTLFGAATGATVGGVFGAVAGSFIGGHYDRSATQKRMKEAKKIKLNDKAEKAIYETIEKDLDKLEFLIEKYVKHNIPTRGLKNKLDEIQQKLEKLTKNKILTHSQAKLLEAATVAYILENRGRTDEDKEKLDQALFVLKLMVEEYKQVLRNQQVKTQQQSSVAIKRQLRKEILEPLTHDPFFKLVELYLNTSNAAYTYTGEGTNLNLAQINALEKINADMEAISSKVELNKMIFDSMPEGQEKDALYIAIMNSDKELIDLYQKQKEILATQDTDILNILERTSTSQPSAASSARTSEQNSPVASPPDTPVNKRKEEKGKEKEENEEKSEREENRSPKL